VEILRQLIRRRSGSKIGIALPLLIGQVAGGHIVRNFGVMKLGYARVSTEDQNLEGQCQRLFAAGCEKLFEEKISGAMRNRPKLEKLIEHLRKDDILVMTRLDRLARSTSDLLRTAERLTEKSTGLQSLDEPWVDTTSPSGRMVMTIFAGIAEFERTLIISRTNDGRVAAKARGVAFGRPKKMRPDQQQLARELVRDGKSISAVARTFDVHPATIYRVTRPCGQRMGGASLGTTA
jgi:DNA invertase Pin-like site-specific DNA recombinase